MSSPGHTLRTPSLRPAGIDEPSPFMPGHPARLEPWCEYRQAFPERVHALAEARARRLQSEGRYPRAPAGDLASGRILAYDPDSNLADGAARQETGGFFGDDNVPPWDTWLCFVQERDGSPWQPFDGYLLAWMPPRMIDRAERGIWINPEECIVWADSLDQPFIEELRAAGLLDR